MYILTIETTGRHASVAWIDEQGNIQEEVSGGTLNHLQEVMPMIERLLEKSGILPQDLTCIAASAGPGSFTGIRIGVASARALAQALEIPTIAVPTLKTFAYHAPEKGKLICPLFDARRNQIYASGVCWGSDGQIEEKIVPGAYLLDDFFNLLPGVVEQSGIPEILFFGDGIETYEEKIRKWKSESPIANVQVSFAPDEIRLQRASSVAKLALWQFQNGEFADFEQLKPLYMRKAEAERKLMQIRPAQISDVKKIAMLDKICFSKPWSERSFREEITTNRVADYLVASASDQIAGYVGLWRIGDEGHITNVAVAPDFRRTGVAVSLLEALIDRAGREGVTTYTLEVRVSNRAAIGLYHKLGFKEGGIRKKYYEDNSEDALIMWKTDNILPE